MLDHRSALLRWLIIAYLQAILLLLVACSNPFDRSTPFSNWGEAMLRDDYSAAQRFIAPSDAANWRSQTDQLNQQHGDVQSYQKGDLAPSTGDQRPIAIVQLTWHDGFIRCLRMQETEDHHIAILNGGYQDCTITATP